MNNNFADRPFAIVLLSIGILSVTLSAAATAAPPPREWAALMAERDRSGKQYQSLAAAGKTADAMPALEKLLEADRRLLELPAITAPQEDYQRSCRKELIAGLTWRVKQHRTRQEWSAAAKCQQALSEFCEATYGKAEFRTVSARNLQTYFARLATLEPADAAELVKIEATPARLDKLARQGKLTEALPLAQEALRLRRQWLGEDSPYFVDSLNNLAMLYCYRSDHARAKALLLQAVESSKKAVGEKHPTYAKCLQNLASLYRDQGDYARAEPLFTAALEIWKQTVGEEHSDYAEGLNGLALLHFLQGDYAFAEPLLRQTVEIKRKVLGENHPDYAQGLSDLAMLYQDRGDFARAEPLLRQALEISKHDPGADSPHHAVILSNLAGLYRDQGDFARTLPLLRKSLEILREAQGETSVEFAACLSNLASVYEDHAEYARAEPLYRRASEIEKIVLGENNPGYATSLNNLARMYFRQSDYARSEPLSLKAIAIRREVFGENHPRVALSLNNLALLYQHQGDLGRAERLLQESLEIRKKTLGENHSDYGQSLGNLARLYETQGDYARAESLSRQAVSIQRRWLEATAVVQSERQQLAMLDTVRFYLDQYLAMTEGRDQFAATAYQQMLVWKGMVFRRARLARAAQQTPELKALFQQLQQLSGQFAKQAWATPEPSQQAAWRERVERLSAQKERLEAELSNQSAAYRQARRQATPEDLQQALPKGVVLVDLLQYVHYTPGNLSVGRQEHWEPRCVAFVIRHAGPVVRINLGPATPLGEAIDTWRATFGAAPPAAAAGKLLRTKIWEPIAAHLQDAELVLVSPDGALSRLPLAALPGQIPGKFLLEERAIAIVPAAQMIPELLGAKDARPWPGKLLLVGNIDYDAAPEQREFAQAEQSESHPGLRAVARHFGPLPGTREEVATIENLYRLAIGKAGVLSLQNAQATKSAILAAAGQQRYLHLATHGFFISQQRPTALAQRGSDQWGEMLHGSWTAAMNPGLLCGLALAGANRTGSTEAPGLAADQGLVTAEEIASQNFDGVELVMLSACETGLGQSSGGEGLLGLQRAFQSAGARSVVASLWNVNDAATRALMVAFYTNLWKRKLPKLEALRQAQLTMLRDYDPQADELRGPGAVRPVDPSKLAAASEATGTKSLSPYYWAAFILSGDWQ